MKLGTHRNAFAGKVDQQLSGIPDLGGFLFGSLDQNQRGVELGTCGEYDLRG